MVKTDANRIETSVRSPAKVNLLLRVLGKRPDGYHDIFSLMQPLTLADEIGLVVSEGDAVEVVCDHDGVPTGGTNLAAMAAELVLKEAGIKRSVRIEIDKKIPVAGGLGGGSSNAASVLMALDEMLGLEFSAQRLHNMAAGIGSDVPFFLLRSPAMARGRGEVLETVACPSYHYVLVNPGFGVSASRAYGNLDLTKKHENNILSYSTASLASLATDPESIKTLMANDLEAPVEAAWPEIGLLKSSLYDAGAAAALMSGSGPTVFGLFFDRESAQRAYGSLTQSLDAPVEVFLARGKQQGES